MLVELIVIIWTVIAVVGIGVSLWALVDGFLDRRALRQSADFKPHGPRDIVVRINLRGARASLILHAFFLLLGLRAFIAPPSGGVSLVAVGFILVAATNVHAVGANQWERVRSRRRSD